MKIKYFIVYFILLYAHALFAKSEYMQQIKVWDECTYALEPMRIDLMQLRDKRYEDINATKAIQLCEKSLATYPDDPHVKFLLARAYTKSKLYTKGYALASESCKEGSIGACSLLGGYHNLRIIAKSNDVKKNVLLWLWSCSKGDAQACLNLYILAKKKQYYVPEDLKNTDIRMLALCQEGSYPLSCHVYAKNIYRDREMYNKSDVFEYTTSRSCMAGIEEGCLLYREFLNGKKDKKNREEILKTVYEKSCNNGNAEACLLIADFYAKKKRNKINNITALALYEEACKVGHVSRACRYAGAYYLAKLEGIKQNIPLGLEYLEDACTPSYTHKEHESGSLAKIDMSLEGCYDLAKYRLNPPNEKYKDIEEAKKALKNACQRQYYHTDRLGCKLKIDKCCKNIKH
jgi:TPR repeat protein